LLKWKGWEDRVKADPQFAYKVLIEQVQIHILFCSTAFYAVGRLFMDRIEYVGVLCCRQNPLLMGHGWSVSRYCRVLNDESLSFVV
jgi:hypothetical protein